MLCYTLRYYMLFNDNGQIVIFVLIRRSILSHTHVKTHNLSQVAPREQFCQQGCSAMITMLLTRENY